MEVAANLKHTGNPKKNWFLENPKPLTVNSQPQ